MEKVNFLSKAEMKNVLGGVAIVGPACDEGAACKLVTINGETTTTETGTCSMSQTGTTISCWCSAGVGDGLSKCWK